MNATTLTAKILYAEDDSDDQFFLGASLTALGLSDIMYVADGNEAVTYLEAASFLPSLVVLDLNMPKRDGKETLSFLKSDQRYASIPVVILSTSQNKTDKETCTDMGAASYFQKPFHYSGYFELAKCLQSFVQA